MVAPGPSLEAWIRFCEGLTPYQNYALLGLLFLRYNGKGKYLGNFPEKELDGFFEVTHLPQISELIEDHAAYPLEGYKIKIIVESKTDGRVKVPTSKELESIQFSFTYDQSHSFQFTDTQSSGRISGQVRNVSHVGEDGPNVLRFISGDLEAKPA
jgi:hypothetical protein